MEQRSKTRSSFKAARQATSSAMASTFDALSDIKNKSLSLIEFDKPEAKSDVMESIDEVQISKLTTMATENSPSAKEYIIEKMYFFCVYMFV
jgi:hypothetical protein